MKALKSLFAGLFADERPLPTGAANARAYAVGDIHGRLDLLDRLLDQIRDDSAARPARKTFLIFLGDLIDRGPDSKGVIDRLAAKPLPGARAIHLMGNHEEAMLSVLEGKKGIIWNWLKFGGAECVQSYGLDPERLSQLSEDEAVMRVRMAVPAEHRRFLAGFADTFSFGDYLFVHAGIRPGLPLEQQQPKDLRWIREPFLNDPGDHGRIVVHGHTIVDSIEEYGSRIGIDTGAYRSGVLSAIAIEDDQRWYLSTAKEMVASA
jgi:serine/threonine protein phosphatase 1